MVRPGACVLRDGSCQAALSTCRLPECLCHGSSFPGAGERVMKREVEKREVRGHHGAEVLGNKRRKL